MFARQNIRIRPHFQQISRGGNPALPPEKDPDMKTQENALLSELSTLLDLAYTHYCQARKPALKSADGTIRIEYGNLWWRRKNAPHIPPATPAIETIIIYSSVFSATRMNYFDTLEEAVEVVRRWYEYAKELNEQ